MIKFTTINVDGLEVTREFKTIDELKNEYFSDNCDLPANDDKVIYAEIDGVQFHYPATFEELIEELGIGSEEHIDVRLALFEEKAKAYILDFFKGENVPFSKDEEQGLCAQIRERAKGFFDGEKSPHGLSSEAQNYACDICDIVENILEEKDITIPDDSREDYDEPEEEMARLFGDAYYQMEDGIAELFEEVKNGVEISPSLEEKKVLQIVEYIINNACENTATGEWSIYAEDVCKALNISDDEYRDLHASVMDELWLREEIVDINNENDFPGGGSLDLSLDVDYCKKFEGRIFEYKNGELKKKDSLADKIEEAAGQVKSETRSERGKEINKER